MFGCQAGAWGQHRGAAIAGSSVCAGSRPKEELPAAPLRAGALACRVKKALFHQSQHAYEIQQGSNKYFTSWTPQGPRFNPLQPVPKANTAGGDHSKILSSLLPNSSSASPFPGTKQTARKSRACQNKRKSLQNISPGSTVISPRREHDCDRLRNLCPQT